MRRWYVDIGRGGDKLRGGLIRLESKSILCILTVHCFQQTSGGFFGGEGFILQRLEGDGMAFVHAGGTTLKMELEGNEIRVDTGCIVAFTEGIDYSIERAGNLKSMFFGGEGLFLATLRGTGTVYLQSLPFSWMCDRILAHAPSGGGSRQGEILPEELRIHPEMQGRQNVAGRTTQL